MKKFFSIFTLILIIIIISGCGNQQNSSRGEAIYEAEQQPDFQKLESYFSVESIALGVASKPQVFESGQNAIRKGTTFIHEIHYRTKTDSLKLILLNDDRPPKIVSTFEFK